MLYQPKNRAQDLTGRDSGVRSSPERQSSDLSCCYGESGAFCTLGKGATPSGNYASTEADYLSRGFILHQYRVILTWPVVVFYASTLLLSRAVERIAHWAPVRAWRRR